VRTRAYFLKSESTFVVMMNARAFAR